MAGRTVEDMTDRASPAHYRPGALVALGLTALLACLVVGISYSMAREYGDTAADDAAIALEALQAWGAGIVLVAGLATAVWWTARRSRGRRAMVGAAVATVALTTLSVPAVAVLAVHQKLEAFPRVPMCTAGFTSGPAVAVTRSAQRSFEELAHPGPFSGGGESGVQGCASELMVDEDVDVVAAYREVLPGAGWRVTRVEPGRVEASRGAEWFSAFRDQGAWWVRIGPRAPVR